VVTTVAGRAGEAKYVDGLASNARFDGPNGVAVDNVNRCLYVADTYSNRIRRITFPVDADAPQPPPLTRLTSTTRVGFKVHLPFH
jgi:sugar lactone lactonase YvrE